MQLENSKIVRAVERHAAELVNGKIGESRSVLFSGLEIKSELYGFNRSRKGIVLNVSIGGVKIGRNILKLKQRGWSHAVQTNYNWMLKQRTAEGPEVIPHF